MKRKKKVRCVVRINWKRVWEKIFAWNYRLNYVPGQVERNKMIERFVNAELRRKNK